MKQPKLNSLKKKNVFNLQLNFGIVIFFLFINYFPSFSQSRCNLSHTYFVTSPTCNGSANATIDLTMSGGAVPYIYNWNNSTTTEDQSGLIAGSYYVLIIDQNGCRDSVSINVTQPAPLSNSIQKQDVLCNGGNNGNILTNVSGGTNPYTYNWSNGMQNANIYNLIAGVYRLTIYDYRGCSRKDTVEILQPDAINLVLTSPEPIPGYNISIYQGNDGSIDLSVSGGVSPFNYAWSNSGVTQDLAGLTANTYSVVVTDYNSCTASASIILDQPTSIEMPSGFTPNGDGQNDNFVVHGAESFSDGSLTIFNRWGNIVYEHESYKDQWNGYNTKGEELPDGTYFAILEIKSKDLILKGYVEMKRH